MNCCRDCHLCSGTRGCCKRLSLNIPFTCNFTSRGITAESALCVSCAPTLVEARALNPRKVLCRINVVCSGTAYSPAEMSYMTGIEGNGQAAELKVDKKIAYLCMDVNERTFSIIDELEMQSGRPMIGEILKTRVRLGVDDVKPIGNKVIFKGAAMLTVMYIAADGGETCSADFRAPVFSDS